MTDKEREQEVERARFNAMHNLNYTGSYDNYKAQNVYNRTKKRLYTQTSEHPVGAIPIYPFFIIIFVLWLIAVWKGGQEKINRYVYWTIQRHIPLSQSR